MRKIILSPSDFDLFNTDISFSEFEFMHKHWEAFRRMWREQGKKFWIRFIMTYRTFASDHGAIRDIRNMNDKYQSLIDEIFIFFHENFIDGKYREARNLMDELLVLAQNKTSIQFLGTKSVAKDPFYNKETRDCFRHLFGPPNEKVSYVKVYVLHEVLTKFGGSVIHCLRRWLEATEVPAEEEDTWDPVPENERNGPSDEEDLGELCQYCYMRTDCERTNKRRFMDSDYISYQLEKTEGQPCGPWFVENWRQHEDPRFTDTRNPLYDITLNPDVDWRDGLKFEQYQRFKNYVRTKHKQERKYHDESLVKSVWDSLELNGVNTHSIIVQVYHTSNLSPANFVAVNSVYQDLKETKGGPYKGKKGGKKPKKGGKKPENHEITVERVAHTEYEDMSDALKTELLALLGTEPYDKMKKDRGDREKKEKEEKEKKGKEEKAKEKIKPKSDTYSPKAKPEPTPPASPDRLPDGIKITHSSDDLQDLVNKYLGMVKVLPSDRPIQLLAHERCLWSGSLEWTERRVSPHGTEVKQSLSCHLFLDTINTAQNNIDFETWPRKMRLNFIPNTVLESLSFSYESTFLQITMSGEDLEKQLDSFKTMYSMSKNNFSGWVQFQQTKPPREHRVIILTFNPDGKYIPAIYPKDQGRFIHKMKDLNRRYNNQLPINKNDTKTTSPKTNGKSKSSPVKQNQKAEVRDALKQNGPKTENGKKNQAPIVQDPSKMDWAAGIDKTAVLRQAAKFAPTMTASKAQDTHDIMKDAAAEAGLNVLASGPVRDMKHVMEILGLDTEVNMKEDRDSEFLADIMFRGGSLEMNDSDKKPKPDETQKQNGPKKPTPTANLVEKKKAKSKKAHQKAFYRQGGKPLKQEPDKSGWYDIRKIPAEIRSKLHEMSKYQVMRDVMDIDEEMEILNRIGAGEKADNFIERMGVKAPSTEVFFTIEWNKKMLEIMESVLDAKFEQCAEFRDALWEGKEDKSIDYKYPAAELEQKSGNTMSNKASKDGVMIAVEAHKGKMNALSNDHQDEVTVSEGDFEAMRNLAIDAGVNTIEGIQPDSSSTAMVFTKGTKQLAVADGRDLTPQEFKERQNNIVQAVYGKKMVKLFQKDKNGDRAARPKIDRILLGKDTLSDVSSEEEGEREFIGDGDCMWVMDESGHIVLKKIHQRPILAVPAGPEECIDNPLKDNPTNTIRTPVYQLRMCNYCKKAESIPKTFKKCQKCKEKNVTFCKYYCSRECQAADWKETHREEHKTNSNIVFTTNCPRMTEMMRKKKIVAQRAQDRADAAAGKVAVEDEAAADVAAAVAIAQRQRYAAMEAVFDSHFKK